MEEHQNQDALLALLGRLKEVFDAVDQDDDGFIRVEHFLDLGVQFGQGDEVKKLTKFLDPNAHGRINFKDFCYGVFAIKGCEEILKTALGPRNVSTQQPYETDNGYIYQHGEARLGPPPIIMCTRPYPECSLFGGAGRGGECDMDSTAESGLGWDSSDGSHGNSPGQLIGSACASVISGEEQFEDYGEGEGLSEDVDFSPGSPGADDDARTNAFSDLSSLPSRDGREQLDVYCSSCCKKVNLLNDLEARLRSLKANSPNRKISSTAFGRQLFQHHSAYSSRQGSTEDLFRDSIDSCDVDITEKVSYLEKKVCELENDSLANSDLTSKLKHDNTQLVHRVHALEEQLKDAETRGAELLDEELRRHRDTSSKMEREHTHTVEILTTRVLQLEEEDGELKINMSRLKSQTEKLDQEKQRMTDQLEDTSLRLADEMDLYRKMMSKLWHNRHEFTKEKEAMQELISDLRRELEHLQLFKLEAEHPGEGRGLAEINAKTRETELEHEARRLKQENHKLRDQNDDLNAQILSLSVYEAKNLFACHTKAQSLAAEIDNASRDQLVDALKEQEEINFRLRQYMDKIILAILDHNPSILEIKS